MFKTQFKVYPNDYEKSDKPSLTMPSQAYTIRELLSRFVSGTYTPSQAYREGTYFDGEPSFDDFEPTDDPAFDLADYSIQMNEIEERKRYDEWRKQQDKPVDPSPTPPPAEPVAPPAIE